MKIPVTLNGNRIILDAHADESLMKVLHKNGCPSVKSGCSGGFCGACTILLDDKPAAACKIPAGIVRDSDIVTLDYFTKTEEYSTIMAGFQKAGIKLCGYCTAGKVFSTYQILKLPNLLSLRYRRPAHLQIQRQNQLPDSLDLDSDKFSRRTFRFE